MFPPYITLYEFLCNQRIVVSSAALWVLQCKITIHELGFPRSLKTLGCTRKH